MAEQPPGAEARLIGAIYRYRAFGIRIDSAIELAGFAPVETDQEADASILIAPFPPPHGGDWKEAGWEWAFRVDGVAAYHVQWGNRILVDPEAGASMADMAAFLRTSALGVLLAQRGRLMFHGSAVDSPEGAILILGRVGTGKSTLAAALSRRGFPLLSDEVAIIDGQQLIPTLPEHRLWNESLPALGLETADRLPLRAPKRKFSLASAAWNDRPRPLRAVFVLSTGNRPQAEAKRTDLSIAYRNLTYRRVLLEKMGRAPEILALGEALRHLPHYELVRSRDLTNLDELVETVLGCLNEPPVEVTQEPVATLAQAPAVAATPGLVCLASYPKSGNTWVRALMTAWRKSTPDLDALEGQSSLADRHNFDEAVGLDSELLTLPELLRWRSRLHAFRARYLEAPLLTKVHDVCDRTPDGELLYPPEATTGVIYVIRCPLDVAVSYCHHYGLAKERVAERMANSQSYIHQSPAGGIREALPQRIGNWSEHVLSWVDAPGLRCLLVRYEDMLADTLTQLQRMVEFIGEDWDPVRGQEAVRQCNFEALQKQEVQKGFRERPISSPSFFRKGRAGDWRDSLPPQVAHQIGLDHHAVMERFGYAELAREAISLKGTQQ